MELEAEIRDAVFSRARRSACVGPPNFVAQIDSQNVKNEIARHYRGRFSFLRRSRRNSGSTQTKSHLFGRSSAFPYLSKPLTV